MEHHADGSSCNMWPTGGMASYDIGSSGPFQRSSVRSIVQSIGCVPHRIVAHPAPQQLLHRE